MKKKPQDQRDWHERRIEAARKKQAEAQRGKSAAPGSKRGKPESPESRETFPHRTDKPGQVGLANEARPGLGTRADNVDPAAAPDSEPKEGKSSSKPKATKHGYEE